MVHHFDFVTPSEGTAETDWAGVREELERGSSSICMLDFAERAHPC